MRLAEVRLGEVRLNSFKLGHVSVQGAPQKKKKMIVYLTDGNRKQLLLTETLLKQTKNTNLVCAQNAFRGQLHSKIHGKIRMENT